MKNEYYKPRISDCVLQKKLRTSGAVLITGPKWCGKTWTAYNAAASVVYMQDTDKRVSYMKMTETKPSLLLQGAKPRLIDEWQSAPVLWDTVRFAVDQTPLKGQYILTGSVVVDDDGSNPAQRIEHTGTGRIARFDAVPKSVSALGLQKRGRPWLTNPGKSVLLSDKLKIQIK